MRTWWLMLATLLVPALGWAQPDPVVGKLRGTLKTPAGTESPLVLTIAKERRSLFRLDQRTVRRRRRGAPQDRTGQRRDWRVDEAAADSRLGVVLLAATLTAQGNALTGDGTLGVGSQRFPVSFALQRRLRADVVQHQVEQTVEYFAGPWKFDYVGGEFPPLSIGNRQGAITFARVAGSNFVAGALEGESFGAKFEHRMAIGVDPDADTVVLSENTADGVELLSLGNWRSPLAVVFLTAPVSSGGRTYHLRRVFSILSESAFDMTEEFSVDGGPFRRLGAGHFTKSK